MEFLNVFASHFQNIIRWSKNVFVEMFQRPVSTPHHDLRRKQDLWNERLSCAEMGRSCHSKYQWGNSFINDIDFFYQSSGRCIGCIKGSYLHIKIKRLFPLMKMAIIFTYPCLSLMLWDRAKHTNSRSILRCDCLRNFLSKNQCNAGHSHEAEIWFFKLSG